MAWNEEETLSSEASTVSSLAEKTQQLYAHENPENAESPPGTISFPLGRVRWLLPTGEFY